MAYNELSQDFNATYRIGFYHLPDEVKDKIIKLMGTTFYSYNSEDDLIQNDILNCPDLIITGERDLEYNRIKDLCMANDLIVSRKPYKGRIWLETEEDIKCASEKIEEAAITGNIYKMRHLISMTSAKTYRNSINRILELVRKKDKHTYEHLMNVSNYAELLGAALGLDEETIYRLTIGGSLYDIGKLCFPDSILFNTSYPLPPEKVKIMQQHVQMSLLLIPDIYYSLICDMVLEHHERLDGSGYPRGLKGDKISIEAQILAILDTYDALTTKCSYQKKKKHEEAMEILYKLSEEPNPKLNREIVDVLNSIIVPEKKL